MSDSLTDVAGMLIGEKAVGAVLDYTLDHAQGMDSGETLVSSTWTSSPAGLSLSQSSFGATTATIVATGGAAGTWYTVANLATGSAGMVHDGQFALYVFDPANLGAGLGLPFASVPGALAALRRDRLMLLGQNFLSGIRVDTQYLLDKLAAATAFAERRLRVFLTPREVLPNTAPQSEIDALTAAGQTVYLEPAYDYDPTFFQGDAWGFQPLRQRPVLAVHSMQFQYPTPSTTLWTIPSEWIRVDRKYGTLNLLPVTSAISLPLNAFVLSALGGGRMVPHFLAIRYRAGIENISRDYPDILDAILKQTVLSIVQDCFIPSSSSESVSADGLSQSSSIGLTMSDYSAIIDTKLDSIRDALGGLRMTVV
jgi:hypothetical protein